MEERDELHAWVVTVDMGLGHQRAAYPFTSVAEEGIITVGSDSSSDEDEKRLWTRVKKTYEFLSRVRKIPIIGRPLFGLLDTLQNIPPLYPIRDMSHPSFQVNLMSSFIDKGICRGMLRKIQEKPIPLITSYPVPAIAADRTGYGLIYCIICDAEISRAWVPAEPLDSRIHYMAPCGRAVQRLRSYGVPEDRIFLTGFPLPLEVLGGKKLELLKADTAQRLYYLDPNNRFWPLHGRNITHFLGRGNCRFKHLRKFTLTYAVGGAGAQKEIGYQIAKSLVDHVRKGNMRLNLVAGIREEVKAYFEDVKSELLKGSPDIQIIYSSHPEEYFQKFSRVIRKTDVLWTKPSELSFYCGLGIPIIISPPIGAQEEYNKKWLLEIQAGISQEDPEYTDQWFFDLLNEGRLAESAWDGFLKARKYGTYKILEILETGTMTRETSPLRR